jgi:anti-anti-sigma factor
MPEPTDNLVEVTFDGGVVTVRIVASSVEERAGHAILTRTQDAMNQVGAGLTDIILDFGDVEFINSSGLGACFELRNDAAGRGAQVILYRPTETVLQLFMLVKVESLFTIAHSSEVLRSLMASQDPDA